MGVTARLLIWQEGSTAPSACLYCRNTHPAICCFLNGSGRVMLAQALFYLVQVLFLVWLIFTLKCLINVLLKKWRRNLSGLCKACQCIHYQCSNEDRTSEYCSWNQASGLRELIPSKNPLPFPDISGLAADGKKTSGLINHWTSSNAMLSMEMIQTFNLLDMKSRPKANVTTCGSENKQHRHAGHFWACQVLIGKGWEWVEKHFNLASIRDSDAVTVN